MSSDVSDAVAAMVLEAQRNREARTAARTVAAQTMADVKADLQTRRTFGLRRRHATKLARLAAGTGRAEQHVSQPATSR